MTQYPECYLARELEMCYVNISLITDYDVGHRRHAAGLARGSDASSSPSNNERVKQAIFKIVEAIPAQRTCGCGRRSPAPGSERSVMRRRPAIDFAAYFGDRFASAQPRDRVGSARGCDVHRRHHHPPARPNGGLEAAQGGGLWGLIFFLDRLLRSGGRTDRRRQRLAPRQGGFRRRAGSGQSPRRGHFDGGGRLKLHHLGRAAIRRVP